MSQIWNDDSKIEEKKSAVVTPQIRQFETKATLIDIDRILNKIYNNQKIEDFEFNLVMSFLNGEGYWKNLNPDLFKARYDFLVENANDNFKERYTKFILLNSHVENLNLHVIDDLYNNEVSLSDIDVLYQFLSINPSVINDKFFDKRIKEIINDSITDEFIRQKESNKSKSLRNPLLGEKLMNSELKNEILDSIPKDYSLMEKSIYLYIKLCQILSYDSQYYVDGKDWVEHIEFSHLKDISLKNSNVICYEFVTLFSELLESIGIKSNVSTGFGLEEDANGNIIAGNFSNNHADLDYIVDNILIKTDSTNSILGGDLINAKIGNNLNGITCESPSEYNHMIFEMALDKVYNDLKSKNEFKMQKSSEIALVERLKLLFNHIRNMNMKEVDLISYIMIIKHKYFTDDELKWNLKINIVGKYSENTKYPVVIFSFNSNDILNVEQDTIQYLYDTRTREITKYDNQELSNLFNSDLFRLVETGKIPGVKQGIER